MNSIPAGSKHPQLLSTGPKSSDHQPAKTETRWLQRNNPLYLISTLLMFCSLYLISQGNHADLSLGSVLLLFWLQVLYEVVLLAMSLYLFARNINLFHARLLMILVLVLSSDMTFYQSRIASMCALHDASWIGVVSSIFYLCITVGEMGAIRHFLHLKSRFETNLYTVLCLGLIYMSPHWAQLQIIHYSQTPGFGPWQNFAPWIFATLFQLPVIFAYWNKALSDSFFSTKREILTEKNFFLMTTLAPFFLLPINLTVNVYQDLSQATSIVQNLHLGYILYGAFGVHFLHSILRAENFEWKETSLHGVILFFLYLSSLHPHMRFGTYNFQWWTITLSVVGFLGMNVYTARNHTSLYLVAMSTMIFFRDLPASMLTTVQEVLSSLGRTAQALLLASLSFATLGAGFLVSLNQKTETRFRE